jgi:hypothetical protein
MTRLRRAPARKWGLLMAVLLVGATATAGVADARPDAGDAAVSQAAPPIWCQWVPPQFWPRQWVPPQFWPPECRPAPPPSTTTTTVTPTTSTSTTSTTSTTTPSSTTTTTTPPATGVEQHFQAAGPWSVRTGTATDTSGNAFTLFYPTNLGQSGVDHPILTWGNGTGSSPSNYTDTLRHLTSWGYVVVASNSGQTGWGTEMLAGVDYMVGQNGNPSSIFYQHLDTGSIGALGHSQGATGAVHATINSAGRITTTVPLNFVDPAFFNPQSQMPNLGRLDDPVFFVTGGSDFLSSASAQQNYYNQVTGPAAKAALRGGDHNVVQRAGNAYLGYITAWLKYTLDGDGFARRAFVGAPPEVVADAQWQNQATKNLP